MASDKYKFNYKIPECMIKCFTEYATKNKSSVDKKHIETLAFLVGYKEDNEIIGTDLVFPKQKGAAFDVEDHGKCLPTFEYVNLKLLKFVKNYLLALFSINILHKRQLRLPPVMSNK